MDLSAAVAATSSPKTSVAEKGGEKGAIERSITVDASGMSLWLRVLLAMLTVFVCWLAARLITFDLERTAASRAVGWSTLGTIATYAVYVVGALVVLQLFGVSVGPLVGGLGVVLFGVMMALRDTLTNAIGGVLLAVFPYFRLNDLVQINQHVGYVKEVKPLTTTLTDLNNVEVIIPNSRVWTSDVVNMYANGLRTHDVKVKISNRNNVGEVLRLLRRYGRQSPRVMRRPGMTAFVSSMHDFGTDITFRFAIRAHDYPDATNQIQNEVRALLQKHRIALLESPVISTGVDGATLVRFEPV